MLQGAPQSSRRTEGETISFLLADARRVESDAGVFRAFSSAPKQFFWKLWWRGFGTEELPSYRTLRRRQCSSEKHEKTSWLDAIESKRAPLARRDYASLSLDGLCLCDSGRKSSKDRLGAGAMLSLNLSSQLHHKRKAETSRRHPKKVL